MQLVTIVEQELVCSETKKGASILSECTFNCVRVSVLYVERTDTCGKGQCPLCREDRYLWDGPLIKAPQYMDANL